MSITIDGPNRLIRLGATSTLYSAGEIYSRWKDWFLESSLNAGVAPPAWRVVGGDELGGGSSVPGFFFLREDFGWRIKEPEADIDITINGNILPQTPGAQFLDRPDGAFSPTVVINRENVAVQDILGSILAGDTSMKQLLVEIWMRLQLDPASPQTNTQSSIEFGDITIDLTGDGTTTSTAARRP